MNNVSLIQQQKNIIIILAAFIIAFLSVSSQQRIQMQLQSAYKTTVYKTEVVHTQSVKVVTQDSLTEQISKQDSPAVVTITGYIPISQNIYMPSFSQSQVDQTVHSVGSGFLISSNGTILTNKHIISNPAETYQVTTADGTKYAIKNMYQDPKYDIGIITIDPKEHNNKKLSPLTLGDSATIQVGEYVVAIGTAQGTLQNSVTTGVVSGLNREIQATNPDTGNAEELTNLIQTSAPINPGNSGGPLINEQDQVVGITTAAAPDGQNIGFALPINIVKKTLANYKAHANKSIF